MFGQLLAMHIGLKIFLLIIFLLVVIAASFFLFLGIKKDHKKYIYARRNLKDAKREEFDGLLKEWIEGEEARSFSLIFVEFNAAKEFKDNYGEDRYAWALASIREKVASVLPKGSKVCLYEYDTYAFLIERELSRIELSDYAALCISKAHVPVSCGKGKKKEAPDLVIGAASYDVNDVDITVEDLLRNVEVALAVSGRTGLNDFVVFGQELLESHSDYHYYRELKDAINANEFALCFQPICNLFEGDTIAYEAMFRWKHGKFGVLRPEKFIHVIERSCDINWVGLWAYEQMIIECKKFRRLHPNSKVAFSINLTVRQLSDAKICDEIYRITMKYDVPVKGICFEVGESAVLERNVMVAENIEKLVQCGFMIAVDDFSLDGNAIARLGTRRMCDWVKLGKSFTESVQDGDPDIKNMQALLECAHAGNFLVIAQDIKDSITEEFIKRIGIVYGQGYHLGKPQSFENYTKRTETVAEKQ